MACLWQLHHALLSHHRHHSIPLAPEHGSRHRTVEASGRVHRLEEPSELAPEEQADPE